MFKSIILIKEMPLRIDMTVLIIASLDPKSEQFWRVESRFIIIDNIFMANSVNSVTEEHMVASE